MSHQKQPPHLLVQRPTQGQHHHRHSKPLDPLAELQRLFPLEPLEALEAALAGYQNNFEAVRALFNNLQQAMAHITPTKTPSHLASKPKAVKLLKERGRLQQSIKPLKQMQKNSKLGDAEVGLHADTCLSFAH
jgi:hypothetical protein